MDSTKCIHKVLLPWTVRTKVLGRATTKNVTWDVAVNKILLS